MNDLTVYSILSAAVGALFIAVIWFLQRILSKNDQLHEDHDKALKDLNERIHDLDKKILRFMAEAKKVSEDVVGQVHSIGEKQREMVVVVNTIKENVGEFIFVEEEVHKCQDNIRSIKEILSHSTIDLNIKTAPEFCISHILKSPHLSGEEKQAIVKYKKVLTDKEPHNVERFIQLMEKRIEERKKMSDKEKEVDFQDIGGSWRVSKSVNFKGKTSEKKS